MKLDFLKQILEIQDKLQLFVDDNDEVVASLSYDQLRSFEVIKNAANVMFTAIGDLDNSIVSEAYQYEFIKNNLPMDCIVSKDPQWLDPSKTSVVAIHSAQFVTKGPILSGHWEFKDIHGNVWFLALPYHRFKGFQMAECQNQVIQNLSNHPECYVSHSDDLFKFSPKQLEDCGIKRTIVKHKHLFVDDEGKTWLFARQC